MSSENTYIVGKNLPARVLADELSRCAGTGEVVGLDTETSGINPVKEAAANGNGRIECWSVSTPKYSKVFLWANELAYFKPWLVSSAPKCGHNIYGFDYHMFANHNIKLRGIVGDTMIMSRLLYCSKERSHGLKNLAKNWLNIEQPSFDSLFRRPKHRTEFVQEVHKKQGVVQLLDYRETKRKVGDTKGVPTLFVTGERSFFGKTMEYIPLSDIPTIYPERLDSLYEYAAQDANLTRLLYVKFSEALQKVKWQIEK